MSTLFTEQESIRHKSERALWEQDQKDYALMYRLCEGRDCCRPAGITPAYTVGWMHYNATGDDIRRKI